MDTDIKEGVFPLANIKSSKKAIKVIAKKTENNHELKARVKNLIKDTEKAIAANDVEKATTLFKDVQKYLDQAVSKGLIKSNTSDRQKSRLSNKVKNMK
jgi:small subunit ribosomal protein S20